MSNYKAHVLKQFDDIILKLEALVYDFSRSESVISRYNSPMETLDSTQKDIFYKKIREPYLELLLSIPSLDPKLESMINSLRNDDLLRTNVKTMLEDARKLRGDYAIGLLSPSNSKEDLTLIAEQQLREALFEVTNLQKTYPPNETDKVEKLTKSAVRLAFGETSSQFKEMNSIFSDGIIATSSSTTQEELNQQRISRWQTRQMSLLNSLEVMIGEFRLSQLQKSQSDSEITTNPEKFKKLEEEKASLTEKLTETSKFLSEREAELAKSQIYGNKWHLIGSVAISIIIGSMVSIVLNNLPDFLDGNRIKILITLNIGLTVFIFALGGLVERWRIGCWGAGLLTAIISLFALFATA